MSTDEPTDDESGIRPLAHLHPQLDTRNLLSLLLSAAMKGEIAGAVVITFPPRNEPGGHRVRLHLAGYAKNDPIRALGAASACEYLLRERAAHHTGLK